jgi:hypothetical protein
LDLVACFISLSELPQNIFEGELLIFFGVPPRRFGFSSGLAQG